MVQTLLEMFRSSGSLPALGASPVCPAPALGLKTLFNLTQWFATASQPTSGDCHLGTASLHLFALPAPVQCVNEEQQRKSPCWRPCSTSAGLGKPAGGSSSPREAECTNRALAVSEPGSAMGACAWPPRSRVGALVGMRRRAPPHDSAGVGLAWPVGALARQGNGCICLAYVCPSPVHSQCSAPYLLSTPLCTAGPPPPRRNWVTTANFESADQSSMIWASPRTGLQLGWSGCAKKR